MTGSRVRPRRAAVAAALAATVAAACAVRLGRGGPEELRVVVATISQRPPAGDVGAWLRRLEPHVALLAYPSEGRSSDAYTATGADTAWFAQLALAASLSASGPSFDPSYARIGEPRTTLPAGLGALATWPIEADSATRFWISTGESAAGMPLHHASLRTGREKRLDLLLVDAPGHDVREEVRALMEYVATAVEHDAVILLALRTDDRIDADSLGVLLQPAFSSVARCEDQHDLPAAIAEGALRLYYSPVVRARCDAVRGFGSPFPALLARVVLDG